MHSVNDKFVLSEVNDDKNQLSMTIKSGGSIVELLLVSLLTIHFCLRQTNNVCDNTNCRGTVFSMTNDKMHHLSRYHGR